MKTNRSSQRPSSPPKAESKKLLFDFTDYRAYLQHAIQSSGRGEQGRMANAAGISTSLYSLILKGQKNLSLEQAAELVDHLALPDLDAEYFLALVELGRAGTQKLQARLHKKIKMLRDQSNKISKRVTKDTELSEQNLSLYYSSWLYTGLRNYASIGKGKSYGEIQKRFDLSSHQIHQVLQFCLENGLLKLENNLYSFGAKNTHIGSDSPWVNNHHKNWRNLGLQHMEKRRDQDLFYTCPMSLSQEAADKIRAMLPEFIQQVLKIVGPSESEKVMCWNIDWFEY